MNGIDPRNIFKQFLNMGINPQQIEQMIYQQYPGLKILSNQMKQSGMSPIQFAMQRAKQQNIPIQESMMSNMANDMYQMINQRRF